MATKNLPRTLFECGRSSNFKHERQASNRRFRRETKVVMRDIVCGDTRRCEALPQLSWVEIEAGERVAPAYRWLAKHGLGMSLSQLEGLVHRSFNFKSFGPWVMGRRHLLRTIHIYREVKGLMAHSQRFRFSDDGRLLGSR